MKFYLKKYFYLSFLSLACSLALPCALADEQVSSPINLIQLEDALYKEPWLIYQELLALQKNVDKMNNQQQLWWLVRKAQAENLLYFYDEFDNTLAQAHSLVSQDTSLEIQSLLNTFQGLSSQRNAQYADSKIKLQKALAQAKQGGFTRIYINAKQELAYTKSLTELYEISLKDLQEAYLEAYALEDHFLIALINETYGAIYGYMKDYEKSIEYYNSALMTYQKLGYRFHIAEATYGLASTYRYWKKYPQATAKFEQYRENISYTPNTDISFYASYGLGMTLAEQGECQQALEVINYALSLNGLEDYNAELHKRQASCYMALNQLENAEKALTQAGKIFAAYTEIIGTKWQLELIKLQGELAQKKHDPIKALDLLNEYYQKYTDLLEKQTSYKLIEVRAAMEAEREQVEKILQQQTSKVTLLEEETQHQRTIQEIYLFIVIVCLCLIFIGVIIIQYRNNKKMHLLSIIDPLSNLYNRRYIFDYLNKILTGVSPDKTTLSVMVIDLDDFKKINDNYGHPIGDTVIQKVALVGQDTLRNEDVIGRIGGEEFLCILPRTNVEQCNRIAFRLLNNIRKIVIAEYPELKVTISIGIATLSKQSFDSKTLYQHADDALYQAKNRGKNNLVISHKS